MNIGMGVNFGFVMVYLSLEWQVELGKQPNLVGGWAAPLKNTSSSGGMTSNPIYTEQ